MGQGDAARALETARVAIRQGLAGGEALGSEGRCGEPVAVVDESGAAHSWFVPVLLDGKMTGFVQLGLDFTFLRYAGFPSPVNRALWLDRNSVVSRARALAGESADLSGPVLSFDGSPSRIAWKLERTTPAGDRKTIFVAGDFAYESNAGAGEAAPE